MKVIKTGKKGGQDLPDNVAGADGELQLAGLIRADDICEVMKITGAKVKEAAGLMKAGKSDGTGGFTSYAILNVPDQFYECLACVYRSWLIHGFVTPMLLARAFLPLLKNSLNDPADTADPACSPLVMELGPVCCLCG